MGIPVGRLVDGERDGNALGETLGIPEGEREGLAVTMGWAVGITEGLPVGGLEGAVGMSDGARDGDGVAGVGSLVGH